VAPPLPEGDPLTVQLPPAGEVAAYTGPPSIVSAVGVTVGVKVCVGVGVTVGVWVIVGVTVMVGVCVGVRVLVEVGV